MPAEARPAMWRGVAKLALLLLVSGGWLALLALGAGRLIPARELALDPARAGSRAIVLLDAGRLLSVPITRPAESDSHSPVWSADGEWLAYIRIGREEQQVMVVAPFGGGAPRSLYTSPAGDRSGSSVAWSADGGSVAFTAPLDGWQVIYTLSLAADAVPTQITGGQINAFSPAWSPDGRELAFSWSPAANAEVFVAALDTLRLPITGDSGLQRLTQIPALDTSPAWSPDGTLIAFTSDRDDNSEIYLMAADGSQLRRMTHSAALDSNPSWSPDGQYVWFASNREGTVQVYQMRADCPGDCPVERVSPLAAQTRHVVLRPAATS
jgi:Tol biopolymer transport system component